MLDRFHFSPFWIDSLNLTPRLHLFVVDSDKWRIRFYRDDIASWRIRKLGGLEYWIHRLKDDRNADAADLDLVEDAKVFIGRTLEQQAVNPSLKRAWGRFYRIYSGVIRRFVIRQGIQGSDADDCVQDVWHYVVRKLPEFEYRGVKTGFRSWLYRVVTSVSIDSRRLQARRREISNRESSDGVLLSCAKSARDDLAEREWRSSMIATLLNEMRTKTSRSNYRIIEMRFLEGKNVMETADALGMTPRQVWYRQHRIVKKMRELAEIYTGGMFRPVESVDAP